MDNSDAHEDKVFGKINRLIHLTNEADERGLVLSVAAFSEDLLGRLLVAYLRAGKSTSALVEGFNAPLGTFSARIKAGHSVGLLSDEQYQDLEVARKIRNEFAHNWEGCTFSKQNISDLINGMSSSRIDKTVHESSKSKFQSSMQCILVELSYLLSTLGPGGRKIPTVAAHLGLEPYRGPL